jgi:hypothetical protein
MDKYAAKTYSYEVKMANLVSPGVQVQIIDESFYAGAGPGTVPFIMVATAENKSQPGNTTSIAPGTVPANADKLYLMTSQRELLQTFGNPVFQTQGGTSQNGSELNEYGLYSAYQYLGIANRAWVMRANVDLDALKPTNIAPSGVPKNGSHWLDVSNTSWGIFRSNGNLNSSLAWGNVAPITVDSADFLELSVVGDRATPCFDPNTSSVITANAVLNLGGSGGSYDNPLVVPLTIGMTLSEVVTSINNAINASSDLTKKTFTAEIYDRVEAYTVTAPRSAVSAIVAAGGSGYAVNDILTVVGGTGTAATFKVLTLGASNSVATVELVSGGSYTALATNPRTTTVAPAGGTNATLTVTYTPTYTAAETIYNIRFTCSDIMQNNGINFEGSDSDILDDLGLTDLPNTQILPVASLGTVGSIVANAVKFGKALTVETGVQMYEKIATVTDNGTRVRWYLIGSTDAIVPSQGWKEATPTVLTGTVANPTNFIANAAVRIVLNGVTTVNYQNNTPVTTLAAYVQKLNEAFQGAGVNVVASILTNGPNNYFRITNYDGTSIQMMDTQSPTGVGQLSFLGVTTSQTYYADVTGTPSVAPELTGEGFTITVGAVNSNTINPDSPTDTVADAAKQINADPYVGNGLLIPFTSIPDTDPGMSIVKNSVVLGSFSREDPTDTIIAFCDDINANTNNQMFAKPVTINAVEYVQLGSADAGQFSITNVPGFSQSPATSLIKATVVNTTNLKLVSTNGTYFTINSLVPTSGTPSTFVNPWTNLGIDVGVTYGNTIVYADYSVSTPQPKLQSQLAAGNIWINRVSANRGSIWNFRRYNSGTGVWLQRICPMYENDAVANAGLGVNRTQGTAYVQYNTDLNTGVGSPPMTATFKVRIWTGSAWVNAEAYAINNVSVPYVQSLTTPTGQPEEGALWFNQNLVVDIMVGDGTKWMGYRNLYPATDPNGVILSATEPSYQSDGNTALADNDLWIDTSDLENYPKIYRYDSLNVLWELVDNTDQTSSKGIAFLDARANVDGFQDGDTNIQAMLTSDYVDPDAPSPLAYPFGFLLFNTRYSTNNVKEWRPNYLTTGVYKDRWVTISGNATDGSPLMGRKAQRAMVVRAMASAIASNQELRADANFFNLIAAPGYPELVDELLTLNTDNKDVAFVLVDPPARLTPDGTSIQAWSNNSNNAPSNGEQGLITRSRYAGVYYPWGLATNLDGQEIFVPPSMTVMRTIAFNDQVAYPWFAPAGFTRGLVTAVTSVGYLNMENEYVPLQLTQGQRDVLYENDINPIAFIPGRGLVVYGQKTLSPVESALNRVNVSRLVNYLNYQLDNLAKPFLFEPNDQYTRDSVTRTFESFFGDMIALRAVYDFAVLCDETNNTPERIDRNELWIDIAIKPVKAIEFIYIPLRILNTGDPLPA